MPEQSREEGLKALVADLSGISDSQLEWTAAVISQSKVRPKVTKGRYGLCTCVDSLLRFDLSSAWRDGEGT